MAALLGLVAAAGYGGADFFGGLLSRRDGVLAVVVCSQLAGLGLLVVAVAPFGAGPPTAAALGWGAVAGAAMAGGLVVYFRGLARTRMGVVAPITAAVTSSVPVAAGLAAGERPAAVALVGVAVAVGAVVLVSLGPTGAGAHTASAGPLTPALPPGFAPRGAGRGAAARFGRGGGTVTAAPARVARLWNRLSGAVGPGVGEALVSGVAFGAFFTAMDRTGSAAALWPLLAANLASLTVLVTVGVTARRRLRPAPGSWPRLVATGLLGTGASLAFLVGVRAGLLSLVAVLASLSPAVTVAMARAFAGERLTRLQLLGLAGAVVGVALISLG